MVSRGSSRSPARPTSCAALAPSGDEAPQFRINVVSGQEFSSRSLEGVKVAVLANLDRLSPEQSAGIGGFVGAGGGLLVAPGDRTETRSWNTAPWMPARLTSVVGSASEGKVVAHPAPRTFSGPLMTALGRGELTGAGRGRFLRVCQT